MNGPVKNLTSVLKRNCDIVSYGPGSIFSCFVILNQYWVCILATYGPVKYLENSMKRIQTEPILRPYWYIQLWPCEKYYKPIQTEPILCPYHSHLWFIKYSIKLDQTEPWKFYYAYSNRSYITSVLIYPAMPCEKYYNRIQTEPIFCSYHTYGPIKTLKLDQAET